MILLTEHSQYEKAIGWFIFQKKGINNKNYFCSIKTISDILEIPKQQIENILNKFNSVNFHIIEFDIATSYPLLYFKDQHEAEEFLLILKLMR